MKLKSFAIIIIGLVLSCSDAGRFNNNIVKMPNGEIVRWRYYGLGELYVAENVDTAQANRITKLLNNTPNQGKTRYEP